MELFPSSSAATCLDTNRSNRLRIVRPSLSRASPLICWLSPRRLQAAAAISAKAASGRAASSHTPSASNPAVAPTASTIPAATTARLRRRLGTASPAITPAPIAATSSNPLTRLGAAWIPGGRPAGLASKAARRWAWISTPERVKRLSPCLHWLKGTVKLSLLEGATTPISTRVPRSCFSWDGLNFSSSREARLMLGKLPGWWNGSMRWR